jgi:hypothetical protein
MEREHPAPYPIIKDQDNGEIFLLIVLSLNFSKYRMEEVP